VLGHYDLGHSLVVGSLGALVGLFHCNHALDTLCVRILSPGDHCFLEQVIFNKPKVL
jgi:hypothetical protein